MILFHNDIKSEQEVVSDRQVRGVCVSLSRMSKVGENQGFVRLIAFIPCKAVRAYNSPARRSCNLFLSTRKTPWNALGVSFENGQKCCCSCREKI